MKLTKMQQHGTGLGPQWSIKELAREFKVSRASLNKRLAEEGAPKSTSHTEIGNNDTRLFDPNEVRRWWKKLNHYTRRQLKEKTE